MVQDLPEPARRFFASTIAEGTPLYTVADISRNGQFSLGTKEKSNYLDMTARQVPAAPEGFVWKTQAGKGLTQMSGSDSARWTRFWMTGIVPVARLGGSVDHTRSAFGRYMAEAVIWTPAALLPSAVITWEAVDENTARVVVKYMNLEQAVDVILSDAGQPTQVFFARWSNANPDKVHRLQPFAAILSDYREFQGFRLPTHVEAGNLFGTDGYFPFLMADGGIGKTSTARLHRVSCMKAFWRWMLPFQPAPLLVTGMTTGRAGCMLLLDINRFQGPR